MLLWDVNTMNGIKELHGYRDNVTSIIFLRDLALSVPDSRDTAVRFWRTVTATKNNKDAQKVNPESAFLDSYCQNMLVSEDVGRIAAIGNWALHI